MAAVERMEKRVTAKSNFTRNINKLNRLLDGEAQVTLVTPLFEKMNRCYEELEKAQEEFLAETDIDIETDKDGIAFMEDIDKTHEASVLKYS